MSEREFNTYLSATESPECEPNYDMVDSDEDLERWPNLKPLLENCRDTVVAAYLTADLDALHYRDTHKRVVFIAALCGMLAVIFAILQLTSLELLPAPLIIGGEIVAAIVAGVAVALGLYAAFSNKWLLARETAERCRFLKFSFLISPKLWSGASDEEQKEWLRAQIEPLKDLDKEALKRWAEREDKVVEITPSGIPENADEAVLEDLSEYYRMKRLKCQQEYFDNQAEHRQLWDKLTQFAPAILFFLSVLAALGHFGDELYHLFLESRNGANHAVAEQTTQPEQGSVSVTLIILAACFPVVGAAIRTLRTAYEFGRNALRFRAVSNELRQLADDLQTRAELQAELEVFRGVEKTLEAERREWIRLMSEAEWFG